MPSLPAVEGDGPPAALLEKLDAGILRLERSRPFARARHRPGVLGLLRRTLETPGTLPALYDRAARLDGAGLFDGTDWARPETLLPSLVRTTLEQGSPDLVTLEAMSQLRLLQIATGERPPTRVSAEQASHFLTQVLALNLDRVLGAPDEARRTPLAAAVDRLLRFHLDRIGVEDILSELIAEIERVLSQRPLRVEPVKGMIAQIAVTLVDGVDGLGEARLGADRLVSALFGPTRTCADDPGLEAYRARLAGLDTQGLQQEAYAFARAMHDVGLVSDYHAVFLRWLVEEDRASLLPDALGLSSTGLDALRTYEALVHRLVREALFPETAQAAYGLALLLERGTLYAPPIAPALWRQIQLPVCPAAAISLGRAFGETRPPRVHLLAGIIALLGLPLGVGQGNNPTCQAARALSMWAGHDPAFLLHLVADAARHDRILMHFEGVPIRSDALPPGLAAGPPLDTDPVSVVLVPHLDRVYHHMGTLCADRGEDPHRWINPEFHGWWVGPAFHIAVDVATGRLQDHRAFLERLYASYHPLYNGNQPVIHPQPAGLAVTDSAGRFVGWHAITLLRVALDGEGVMRVYFYNPNNDSGQDWGEGVRVSTSGHGERFGEASLPFPELASRLYLFHDDPEAGPPRAPLPGDELDRVEAMARATWAATRV